MQPVLFILRTASVSGSAVRFSRKVEPQMRDVRAPEAKMLPGFFAVPMSNSSRKGQKQDFSDAKAMKIMLNYPGFISVCFVRF